MSQGQEVFLFQPTQVSGCQLWLDGADRTTLSLSGSTVTQWRDKSGNNANTTTIGGSPVYNSTSNSILLNGSSTYLVGPYVNTTTTVTAFVISTVDFAVGVYSSYYRLLSVGSTAANDYNNTAYSALILHQPNTTNIGGYRNFAENYVSVTTNTRFLLAQQYNGTNATLYLNGTQGGQVASSGSFNTTSYSIGRDVGNIDGSPPNYAYTYWPGSIGEVILYNASLTTQQRQQLEGYLAWKWGLQGSLPSNHPYKSYRPLAQTPFPTQIPPMPIITQNVAAFVPLQISGCQLWLDATDPAATGIPPASGAALTQWIDKSSNRLNGTAVSSPTYQANIQNGLPVIRFNGTNQYINFGNVLNLGTNGITVFMVTKYAINAGNQVGMIGKTSYRANAGRWAFVYDTVAGGPNGVGVDFFIDDTSQALTGIVFNPATRFNIFTAVNNRTSFNRIYANGSFGSQQTFTATANNLSNTDPLYVAAYPNNTGSAPQAGQFMNGDIAEIIVYFSALSDTQRQQVEGYLAWKWGLLSNLPNGHPYKAQPIVPFPARSVAFNGNASSWLPTSITGCQLWLDGADPNGTGSLPATNTSIATWSDKSGNSRSATQVTANLQPSYNSTLKAIIFDGSRYLNMTNAFSMLGSGGVMTAFVVEKRGSSNGTQFWLAGGGSTGNNGVFFGYNTSTVARYTFVNVTDLDYTVGAWANPDPIRIWNAGFSGSIRDMYLNATQVVTQSYTAGGIASWNTPVIGYIPLAGINTYYTGEIYEMLFFNSYLTNAQRQQVEGYLAWKWGLQGNLPANHPYKLWPPPP